MTEPRAAVALIAFLTFPPLVDAQQVRPDAAQLVKQRREMMISMHSNNGKLERMVYGLEPYKPADAKLAVASLVRLSGQVFELFPPGSLDKDSKARPELWQRGDDFDRFSAASRQSIADLAAAASRDSLEELKAAYAKVPPACVACHQAFRIGG